MIKKLHTYVETIDNSVALLEIRLQALENILEKYLPEAYAEYSIEIYNNSQGLAKKIRETDVQPNDETQPHAPTHD